MRRWWLPWRRGKEADPLPERAADGTPPARRVEIPAGDDQAVRAWLSEARGTADERPRLEAIRIRQERFGSAVRTLAAEIAAARGELASALGLLDGLSDTGALLLQADLLERSGQAASALRCLDRVLAQDIDAPGALDRHRRLERHLGIERAPSVAEQDAPTALGAERTPVTIRILAEAGRGGAGTVYEAFDEALGRPVAFKVYHRLARDRDQLLREARTAVRFRGPGVVRIFDVDVDRGFIVMEWAPHGALRGYIARRDVRSLGTAEGWTRSVLATLARVHAEGFVHGDLKPENVLFRKDYEAVLADFGSAQRIGGPALGSTRGYVCPERGAREPANARDDVFAFGKIMDELCAHEPQPAPWWLRLREHALAPRPSRPRDARALLEAAGDP